MQTLKKYDVLEILFLIGLFLFLSSIFVGHQGSLIIDCGREAYFPVEVLKGKILYKDIFNIYGPFSYQFNAFLYSIMGVNLSVLYKTGLVNAFISLASIFLIAKNLSTKGIAFAITLVVMVVCVFNNFIFNFIFPYSYAMTYALSSFLMSALFLILYTKTSKEWFMPLSFFFAGISFASKYEYTLYIVFLAIFVIFIKPLSNKQYFYSAVSFLLVPVLCFGTLFGQGLTFADLQNNILIIKKMVSTKTLKFFYSNFIGLYPSFSSTIFLLQDFFSSLVYFLSSVLLIYSLISLNKKQLSSGYKTKILKWILIIFIMLGIWGYIGYLFGKVTNGSVFSWLALSNLIIFIGFVSYYIKIIGFSALKSRTFLYEFFKNIELKDKCFMLTCFVGILSSLKSIFYININVYGTFMIPIVLITNVVFASDYLPRFFVFIDKSIWRRSISTVLIILSLFFGLKNIAVALNYKNYEVTTQRGSIYTDKEDAFVHNKIIEYVEKNTKPDDKILMLPEGPMINFLTNRASDDIYHSLIPIYIETFGEEKIIEDLSKKMPDFIMINSRNTSDYGYAFMCKDYAFELCDFINKNYHFEQKYGSEPTVLIYKNKKYPIGH
jgi:hypothetical protein